MDDEQVLECVYSIIDTIESNSDHLLHESTIKACMEDILISIENNIECGDVLRVSRMNDLYAHYGVALGDGYVIHCNGEILNGLSSLSSSGLGLNEHHDSECAVEKVTLSSFRFYPETPIVVEQKTNFVNKEKIHEFMGTFHYNLITNNCEHFANFLTNNTHTSSQVKQSIVTTSNVVITTGVFVITHYYSSFLLLPAAYLFQKYYPWQ